MIRRSLPRLLDASFGVQCRAGLALCPRMHAALGTLRARRHGAVEPRVVRRRDDEIDAAIAALSTRSRPAIAMR